VCVGVCRGRGRVRVRVGYKVYWYKVGLGI
jgi:hypothetical protein